MDFLSKFTKPDESKPSSEGDHKEPDKNADLFNSAKIVAGAAQSYFGRETTATYDNSEVANAAADILDAAAEYGKLDKTQGLGKYVEQAENYLKEYQISNKAAGAGTAAKPPANGYDASAEDSPIKSDASSDKTPAGDGPPAKADVRAVPPTKYGTEQTRADTSTAESPIKSAGDDDALGTDAGDSPATKADVSDEYRQSRVDKSAESTGEESAKKPSGGGPAARADSGYEEDTEEGLPTPSAGGAAVDEVSSDKVSQVASGYGNVTKSAGES